MKIIVDAFGGDNAPLEVIKGCALAVKELKADILLVGDEAKIKKCAQDNKISLEGIEIKHAPDVIEVEEHPGEVLKGKKNSSMAVGLKALSDGEGDAFVSAGSTGALVMGGTFIVKRIKGVKRPALGTVLPALPKGKKPFMLIDLGANADCKPEMLNQFGIMGNIYMKYIMNTEKPRVALANIGAEETKGDELRVAAFEVMKNQKAYDFAGNVEIRDVPFSAADVVVADGFTGNTILKMYEGTAGAIKERLNEIFKKNIFTMLAYLVVLGGFKKFKDDSNYKKYGGAPLLGLQKTVIKAHGSSDAEAIKNAVRQAIWCAEKDIAGCIEKQVSKQEGAAEES